MSSFLTETVVRRLATVPRAVAIQAPRAFTTHPTLNKTVTESAKDSLKSVDRAVSDKIVDGINVGRKSQPLALTLVSPPSRGANSKSLAPRPHS